MYNVNCSGEIRPCSMAGAYSDDLRRKVLEAHRDGEGSLSRLAVRFRVSEGWTKKISAALLHTGQMERPAGKKRGRASKVTADVLGYLQSAVAAQSDLTLHQLQDLVERDQKTSLSIGRLWLVLKEMGLRLKKNRSTPLSKTPSGSGSSAGAGRKKPGKSTRHG